MKHVDPRNLPVEVDQHDFLAWLRSARPSGSYSYMANDNCALAQYLKERRITTRPHVEGVHWWRSEAACDAGAEGNLIPEPLQTALAMNFSYVDLRKQLERELA